MEPNKLRYLTTVICILLPGILLVSWSGVIIATPTKPDQSCELAHDLVFVMVPIAGPDIHGSGIFRMNRRSPGKEPVPLTGSFFSACDPDISPDGTEIVFAGKKKKNDHWQIWLMDLKGKNKKQITRGDSDSFSPLYAGTLFHLDDKAPVGQLIYVGKKDGKTGLFSCEPDGKNPRPISYTLYPASAPDVLPNGRLIFSSLNATGIDKTADLLSLNIDGTDLMGYLTHEDAPGDKRMARVSPDGRVYYIESGYKLAYIIQHQRFRSYTLLNVGKDKIFHSPCPLPNGDLIASVRENSNDSGFGLYDIDKNTGNVKRLLFSKTGYHCLDAHPLAKKVQAKGRSSFVAHKQTIGSLYCINVYISEMSGIKNLTPGTVKHVQVFQGNSNGDANGKIETEPLGTAPVEPDGSFYIKVPARTPIAFQLLDADNKILGKRSGWTWVMPRESRGCIGCHEHRELSPPNRFPEAFKKKPVILEKKVNK